MNMADDNGKATENLTKESGINMTRILPPREDPLHTDPFFSLTYVMRGTCRQTIHGRDFTQEAGTLSCIPSGFTHGLVPDSDGEVVICQLNSDLFRHLPIPDMLSFSMPVVFPCGNDPFVTDAIRQMGLQQEKRALHHDTVATSLFTAVLAYVLQNFRDVATFVYLPHFEEGYLWEMFRYAYNNYPSVTLRSLSEQFHYSESYLCRVIKRNLHVTFTALMKQFRLERAADMLRQSDRKVTEVCEAVGYRDVSRFIRDFQILFHVTPGKFQRQEVPK